jgi:hypothetical protein
LVVNEKDETTAINSLIKDFREYALEYYKDIEFWSSDMNRRNQMKSILKVLLTDNDEEIRESFVCQVGKN